MKHGEDMSEPELAKKVGRKAERKIRARRDKGKSALFWVGMFGLVGWAVAIPTLLGIAVGVWLDSKFNGRASWTLTMLVIGVALGCLNAWFWVKKESKRE